MQGSPIALLEEKKGTDLFPQLLSSQIPFRPWFCSGSGTLMLLRFDRKAKAHGMEKREEAFDFRISR
jgi:hypothetical protein